MKTLDDKLKVTPAKSDLVAQADNEEARTARKELVNSDEIQTLNRDYRNKDKPTNVLSFPFEAPPGIDIDLLGDIIICPQVVFEEAQAQGKPYLDHFAHILIHGVLHLLGYDHLEEQEAEQMESKEIGLLAELNIRNPYGEEFDHA
ncbi:MAG: rRNA maturation RNase YbeY [Gammaproteobacteria bacterium]|nr:rRNA maturation RNase YbeY [Gammaproteobacteria bacterium]